MPENTPPARSKHRRRGRTRLWDDLITTPDLPRTNQLYRTLRQLFKRHPEPLPADPNPAATAR